MLIFFFFFNIILKFIDKYNTQKQVEFDRPGDIDYITNVKDKDKPENRQGAVYNIKCCDCQASYIGETGRNLSMRLTEHKRATRNGDVNNDIAQHHLKTKHQIDWDSATCITYSTDYH